MNPYRTAPSEPRFICVVCFRSVAAAPGSCRRCGVPRRALSDEGVGAELRAKAVERVNAEVRRDGWIITFTSLTAGLIAAYWLSAFHSFEVGLGTFLAGFAFDSGRKRSSINQFIKLQKRRKSEQLTVETIDPTELTLAESFDLLDVKSDG